MKRNIDTEFQITNGVAPPNKLANIDYYYGTYSSLQEALETVVPSLREKGRTVGVEFPVPGTNPQQYTVVEYWFKSGILDSDLVVKSPNLVSDTIAITEDNGDIRIEYTTTADTSIKQFYVNEQYQYDDGTGSILKPFKKLTKALSEVIGEDGTRVNPQYKNAVINLQSGVTVTKADLDAVPKLGGRLSVNFTTIQSDSDTVRNIQYGLDSDAGLLDYPLDTQELINLAKGSATDLPIDINIDFKNIIIATTRVKGCIRHWSYDGHGVFNGTKKTSSMGLTNVTVYNRYLYETYVPMRNSDGTSVDNFYGLPVKCQSTIVNDTPHVYFYGFGNIGEGTVSISNLTVNGSSQTGVKLFRTTCGLGEIKLLFDPWLVPVQNQNKTDGIYLPKTGLYAFHNDSSFSRINKADLATQYAGTDKGIQGGYDALFRFEKTDSASTKGTGDIDSGMLYETNSNSIVSLDESFLGNPSLTNCDFRGAKTVVGAFVKTGNTNSRSVTVDNSIIRNVKVVTPGVLPFTITPSAITATINGAEFSNVASYDDDAGARAAGLINGNSYFNRTTQIKKRLQ